MEVESFDLCLEPNSFESCELTLSLLVNKDYTMAFDDFSGLIAYEVSITKF